MDISRPFQKYYLSEVLLILISFILRVVLILGVEWSNSSDLANYFWAAERVVSHENPYLLWRDNIQGPRSDLLPLELLLLSGITYLGKSPYAIRAFFAFCDLSIMLLLAHLFQKSPLQRITWLLFYGLGPGPLFLFVLTPTDKTLLFALILSIIVLTESKNKYHINWIGTIGLGVLAALKWIGLVIAFPILHVSGCRLRRFFCLTVIVLLIFVLSHIFWFPNWQVVYEFRSSRLHVLPFHAGVALILQEIGLPMPQLYLPLMGLSWAICSLAYFVGWIDWKRAAALLLWAFVYWTPDCTPQMLLFVSMVLLIGVDWSSWQRILLVWMGMLFHTWVSAASVYPIIGGPLNLQWATNFTGIYGSVRTAALSQVFPLICLLLALKDSTHAVGSHRRDINYKLGGGMNSSENYGRLPQLQEHDFRSSVPVVGPLISLIRRLLYNLTAKWGVWAVIQQQNRINRMMEERLHNLETLLVDLDRDLALLTRTVAEIEISQRQLIRMLRDQSPERNYDEGA